MKLYLHPNFKTSGAVFGLLLTLLIIDGILVMVIVLLQAGKGGGLAAMGGGGGGAGTESFMGGRQAATVLTKSTWISGGVFLALALVLSIMSSRSQEAAPLLEQEFRSEQTAPQPILPGGATGDEGAAGPGEVVPGLGGQGDGAAPEGGEGPDGP